MKYFLVFIISCMLGFSLMAEVPQYEKQPIQRFDARTVELLNVITEVEHNGSKTAQREYAEFLKTGNQFTDAGSEAIEPGVTLYKLTRKTCYITIAGFNCLGGATLSITERVTYRPDLDPIKSYTTRLTFWR